MSKPNKTLGERVLSHMKLLGVIDMPRNYEVFYHAMSGSMPALARDLEDLGDAPSQGEVDKVVNKHFKDRAGEDAILNTQTKLTDQIDHLRSIAINEAGEMQKLTSSMTSVTQQLLSKEDITQAKAVEALGALIAAARLKAHNTDQVAKEFIEQGVELEKTKAELEEVRRLAHTDPLTQALNRRAFDDALNAIYEQKDSYQYSLVMLDIDHFKKINDTYGHPTGDKVLKFTAAKIKENLRGSVKLYRTGGEEFAFILQNVDSEVVHNIANRVRLAVEKNVLTDRNGKSDAKLAVTISLGFCMADQGANAMELMDRADKALYFSKNANRNCVTNWATIAPRLDTTGRYEMYLARGVKMVGAER